MITVSPRGIRDRSLVQQGEDPDGGKIDYPRGIAGAEVR
jgi:hypothetical protein